MSENRSIIDEKELLKAIKNSNNNAFKELSEIYYKQLYGFIWRRIGDSETVKDILQDLLLNIWKLRHNLDEERPIKPYLFAAANNLIINYSKKKTFLRNNRVDLPQDGFLSNSSSSLEWEYYINDALKEIPENLRVVFMMNKFEGFKYAEIAEILRISEKTVESRMSKILKFLRKKYIHALKLLLLFFQFMIVFFAPLFVLKK